MSTEPDSSTNKWLTVQRASCYQTADSTHVFYMYLCRHRSLSRTHVLVFSLPKVCGSLYVRTGTSLPLTPLACLPPLPVQESVLFCGHQQKHSSRILATYGGRVIINSRFDLTYDGLAESLEKSLSAVRYLRGVEPKRSGGSSDANGSSGEGST